MSFIDFLPILQNKRAALQPLQLQHAALLAPLAFSEPELFRYMSASILCEQDLHDFLYLAVSDRERGLAIPFIIYDKHGLEVAGSTRFGNIDLKHKRAEIGWTWIASRFHNSGLNKAVKLLMLQHAFECLALNRVEIKTNELNQNSRRAIESIGGQYEGLFRHHMVNEDGSLRNTVYYSILKEEWPELKERVFGKYRKDWE